MSGGDGTTGTVCTVSGLRCCASCQHALARFERGTERGEHSAKETPK